MIDILCLKLSTGNGIFSKLLPLVQIKTCFPLYYSLFCSHFLYCCLVWSYSKPINFDQFNNLQKRCIRILAFSDFKKKLFRINFKDNRNETPKFYNFTSLFDKVVFTLPLEINFVTEVLF